ncbi:MAG: hypothetical protein D6730_19670 [Bacteroidetes bacterium]|nr:MAG: hypothetical protein D6730_19670 [Bacteroidota bacterium]
MALLTPEEMEGISPQDSIIVPPAEVASAKTRQEQEEIKPESLESKAVSYSYSRPYVQQAPGDNSNSDCEIRIEEVKLGISETEIRMSLKGCFQIDLFGPDNTRYAFYLRDPSRREYKLRRFRDIASGREIQVGSQKTFSMYFDPLPRDTRIFDLMEGHVQHAQNRNWWNFKGVELKHQKQ